MTVYTDGILVSFQRVPQPSHRRPDDPDPVLVDEPDDLLPRVALFSECHQRIFVLCAQSDSQSVSGITSSTKHFGNYKYYFSSCGFTSKSNVYFFIREQIRKSPIDDLCLGLQFIPQEFANLQVTRDEFLCMKALILLNTGNKVTRFLELFFSAS